jgi:hypothetical protein
MNEISAQATQELRLIEPIVSRLTGRPSLWNGVAEARVGLGAFGVKTFGCQIIVDADRASQPVRWRTNIHEMLHAHTNGLEQSAVENYRGWEEGIVEQLQRLLRPQVLAGLSDNHRFVFSAEDEPDVPVLLDLLDSAETVANLIDGVASSRPPRVPATKRATVAVK